jgi:hypothetical protein
MNNNKNRTAWIIGTGPSLKGIDVSKLKNEHTVTFNRAYVAFNDWGFEPTYYLAIDSNDLRAMYKDVNNLIEKSSIKYFFLSPCHDNDKHTSEIHYQDKEIPKPGEMFINKNNVYFITKGSNTIQGCSVDHENNLFHTAHHPNAGFLGVKLLYALGYSEVAFVGCDARYKDNEESNKYITKIRNEYASSENYDVNHFRNDYFGKGMRFGKPNQEQIISLWREGKKQIDLLDNFKVYSCTENSNLNNFYDYIPFEEFLKGKR